LLILELVVTKQELPSVRKAIDLLKSVGIIDYGAGNILNVVRAFDKHQIESEVISTPSRMSRHSHIVLPGVGSFQFGMNNLKKLGLADKLLELAHDEVPILGICLGMQLLAQFGNENGRTKGFGLIKGEIVRLNSEFTGGTTLSIPNTGWTSICWQQSHFVGLDVRLRTAYFNHSFFLSDSDKEEVVATIQFGPIVIPAVVASKSVTATQFHPEKSGKAGLHFLSTWFKNSGSSQK
jgi:glutamine amidotransferase